ncbi:hypothetical protein Hte_008076 [Hypoxylon texense]
MSASLSSITTSVPTGLISEWCIQQRSPRAQLFGGAGGCPEPYRSGTSVSAADFQSFCCDGVIVNTAFDIYNDSTTRLSPPYGLPLASDGNHTRPVSLSDLVCCGVAGLPQSAALDPRPRPGPFRTACVPGAQRATPLLSLAASAASDASAFPVTYAPAPTSLAGTTTTTTTTTTADDESATVTNDLWGWATPTYGAPGTPVCFYANTASGVDGLAEVTVPATYVAPTSSATDSASGAGAPASTSVPSAGSSFMRAPRRNRTWVVMLGLAAVSLLIG